MTPEIRNLKGEIIQDTDEEKWYQLSTNTWLLIGGLILFNVGCFLCSNIIDKIFRLLDIRLWPWWYYVCLALLVAFSAKWFFIYRNWEDFDELEAEAAKRFNRMAVAVTGVMAILVFLNTINVYIFLSDPLVRWLGYGDFTWVAFFLFGLIFCVVGPVVYLVKEWVITFLSY